MATNPGYIIDSDPAIILCLYLLIAILGTVAFVGSHLDVVPANPETWERNPFKLAVEVLNSTTCRRMIHSLSIHACTCQLENALGCSVG